MAVENLRIGYLSDIISSTSLLLQSCALDWMGQQSISGIWFLKEFFSAVLDSPVLVKSLMDKEYELKLRIKR